MPSLTKVQTGFLEPQGAFTLDPGTASAPGLRFSTSAATGMFSPSAGVLGFSTGSTQNALTILSGGNVGIGTTNPNDKLVVGGNIWMNSDSYKLYNGSSNNSAGLYFPGSTVRIEAYNGIRFHSSADGIGAQTQRVCIEPSGNVGIGTTNPTSKLHVTANEIKLDAATDITLGYYLSTQFEYSNISTNNHGDFLFASNLKVDGGSTNHNISVTSNHGSMTGGGILIGGNAYENGTNSINFFTKPPGTATAGTVYSPSAAEVVIKGGGNVGIGTTNPNYKLVVYGTGNANEIRSSDGTVTSQWYQDNGGLAIFGTTSNHPQIFRTNGSEKMRIGTNGNVGIGTTNILDTLHVHTTALDIVNGNAIYGQTMAGIKITESQNTNASVGIWFGTGTSHWSGISGQRSNYLSNWGTDLRFYTHEDATNDLTYTRERLRITSTGNVGIGTTNPLEKLDVRGNIFVPSSSYISKQFTDNTEDLILRGYGGAGWVPWISYTPSSGTPNRGYKLGAYSNDGTAVAWYHLWNGSFGIGVTPQKPLHIYSLKVGADSSIARLENQDRKWDINIKSGNLVLGDDTATADRIIVDTSGRILMGVASWTGSAGNAGGIEIQSANYVAGGQVTERLGSWRATANDNNGSCQAGIDIYRMPRGGGVQSGTEIRFYTGFTYVPQTTAQSMTLDQSGNLGIGITNPQYRLHAFSSTSAVAALVESTQGNSDNVQLRFKGISGERWAIGNNVATGGTGLNFDIFDLVSFNNRLRIDSAGNVGIGTTNPTSKLHISGSAWNNTTGGDVVISNSTTIGSSITFRPTNSTSFSNGWSLYAGASQAAIGDGSIGFWNHTISERPFYVTQSNNAVIQNGNLIFNTAGRGIDFSAYANAAGMTSELLDDYETGTWTPVWESTGTLPTLTYSAQSGYYVKIGRVVHFWGRIYMGGWGGGGGSGNIRVGGLPFASNSDSNHGGPLCQVTFTYNGGNAVWPAGATQVFARVLNNSTSLEYISLGVPTTQLGDNGVLQWTSNPQMYNNYFSGSYFV